MRALIKAKLSILNLKIKKGNLHTIDRIPIREDGRTMKPIETHWEVWEYDVWGNEKDGFDVNDRYCISRDYPIMCKVEVNNVGTSQEFKSAYPSSYAIKQALSIKKWIHIDIEGDDLSIYVYAAKNGYPLGELHCISHNSLSPIKIKE